MKNVSPFAKTCIVAAAIMQLFIILYANISTNVVGWNEWHNAAAAIIFVVTAGLAVNMTLGRNK